MGSALSVLGVALFALVLGIAIGARVTAGRYQRALRRTPEMLDDFHERSA